jgi:hypothetical protein
MTLGKADLTRQWVNLFRTFPSEYQDDEIAQWVADRRIGALIALFAQDRDIAREELRELRRRYPKDFARAQKEHQGDFDDWDDYENPDFEGLTDRQWEELQRRLDREQAEYEWVEEKFQTHRFVVRDRSRLIDRIKELDTLEHPSSSVEKAQESGKPSAPAGGHDFNHARPSTDSGTKGRI